VEGSSASFCAFCCVASEAILKLSRGNLKKYRPSHGENLVVKPILTAEAEFHFIEEWRASQLFAARGLSRAGETDSPAILSGMTNSVYLRQSIIYAGFFLIFKRCRRTNG